MDEQLEILLHSYQNIKSVNADSFNKIQLDNNLAKINEYDIRNAVNATEVFDAEREANRVYRIYGRIEFMSLLNGLKNNYEIFEDFFKSQADNSKNILNSFDFYLVRPTSSGYTHISGGTSGMIIDEKFNSWYIASPSDYPNGWNVMVTTNSYVEQSLTNQAHFVLDNQYIFATPFNLVTLYKDIPAVYGDLVIRTQVDVQPTFVPATDLLTITLSSYGTAVATFPLLTTGLGIKEYTITIPQSTPITRVSIMANSNNKSIYMDYLQIEKTDTDLGTNNSTITYNRYFEVIATPNQFELFPIGFSNNVFGEQAYTYNFNVDINISPFQDNFGFPVTELFLYAQYKKSIYPAPAEILSAKLWSENGTITYSNVSTKSFVTGDTVMSLNGQKFGDIINYSKLRYLQVQTHPEQFYITTPYSDSTNRLIWKYNPFIPLRLRYLTDNIYTANISGTSYAEVQSIPYYATNVGGGNYVWRNIMPEGYRDPLTGIGNDLPFVNKRRYLFSSIVLDVIPDLDDQQTLDAFSEVWYSRNAYNFNKIPLGDINNIGKPCL
jgi:hypothetical protein